MAGTILTPTAVWKDFRVDGELTFEVAEEEKKGDLQITKLYLSGRKVGEERVKIYGVLVRNMNVISAPAILSVQDLRSGADGFFAEQLAKEGYASFTVDVAGKCAGRERYTVYPSSLSCAEFNPEKFRDARIEGEITDTFWYEWGCVIKYAFAFLKNQRFVSTVGLFGINGPATPLWYLMATEKEVACAVIIGNAGWRGYDGIYKYENTAEPQFDEDKFKFLAAADPQAYARHVACPTYIISPTNSVKYELDRAYDTITRIGEGFYSATDYSVGARDGVAYDCYKSALVFLKKFLYGGTTALPAPVSVKAEIEDGEILAEVSPDMQGLKKLVLYAAEGEIKPQYRAWRTVETRVSAENGTFAFKYRPYGGSKMVSFFARATYANGFSRTSPVVYKRFDENEIVSSQKFRILYSSRIHGAENSFYPAAENLLPPYGVETVPTAGVETGKGPMDMVGICCSRGLLTFKVNIEKYRPAEGMLLMMDVYGKTESLFTVKLVADFYDKKTEYCATVKVIGGDVWQNFKLEQNKFKTFEGMILKSYEKIQAIEFVSDGECVINNVLWV